MATMPLEVFAGVGVVLGAAALAGVAPLRTSRPIHFIQFRYPSWIWAMLGGTIGSGVILHFNTESSVDAPVYAGDDWVFLAMIVLGSLITGSALAEWFAPKPPDPPPQNPTVTAADTPQDRLMAWIDAPESPITQAEEDLFGFASTTAQRMGRHLLYDPYCPSIGLVGPYGSGKTSILHMLNSHLREPQNALAEEQDSNGSFRRVWVAWVGSWGQTSGASAAQQVLDAALDELANHVDCLAVSNLPQRYQAAMYASNNSWLGLMAALGGAPVNPEDTLRRFDPILEALNAHLVLFIEDLDRNQSDPTLFGEVQALLDRLKQNTRRIRIVLAIGGDAVRHIDFAKLCDRYEMLGSLPKNTTEHIVTFVATTLRKAYPEDVDWLNPNRRDQDRPYFQVPDEMIALLSQPRSLRLALRYVRQAWPQLHGEIDLQEALLVAALRASSPSAFEFLATHIIDLRGYLSPTEREAEEHGDSLAQTWDQAMTGVPPLEKNASEAVLNILFPGWKQGRVVEDDKNPQSIRNGPYAGIQLTTPSVDYWQRLFAEEVTGRRDQEVAKAIRAWIEEPQRSPLPQLLVNEQGYAEHFERLLPSTSRKSHPLFLDRTRLRRLTEQVHARVLEQQGVSATGDEEACIVLWRIAGNRATPEDHLEWVEQEIQRALCHSLRFALDLERRWTYKKLFQPQLQPKARTGRVFQVRKMIEDSGVEGLIQILDSSFPYSLNHLIRHQYDDAVFGPADWQWLVPQLLEKAEWQPTVLVPHLAMLVTQTAHRHEVDEETGLPGKTQQLAQLDEAYLLELVPDDHQRIALMKLIASDQSYPNLQPAHAQEIRQIQDKARQWLDSESS